MLCWCMTCDHMLLSQHTCFPPRVLPQDPSCGLNVQELEVEVDDLLPDVLAFPEGTDLHDHPLVKDGRLILQVGPC